MSEGAEDREWLPDSSLIGGVTALPGTARQMGGYTLLREVGRGAMGEVWLANDPRLDRKVAIKTMRCEIAEDPEYIKRFHREARAVARLSHPHIIQIYGAGEDEGMVYFVMEWINGRTLGNVIRQSGAVAPREALRIIGQAVTALGYAAAQGVIHRDIKPGNIMVDSTGSVKIADFGLAKLADGQTCMTQTGVCLGSPNYMSPEACRGEELDHRSDQYSLGVTFYEMLKGELPYSAPTPMSVMFKHVHDPLPEPVALRSLNNGIWLDLLRRMTAKSADERFQTYEELSEALSQVESASNGSLNGISPIRPTSTALYTGSSGGASPFSGTSMLSTGMPEMRQQQAQPLSNAAPARDWKKLAIFGGGGLLAVFIASAAIYWAIDFFSGSGAPPPAATVGASTASNAAPVNTPASGPAAGPELNAATVSPPPAGQMRSQGGEEMNDEFGVAIPRPEQSRAAEVPLAFKTASPDLFVAYQNRDFSKMSQLVDQILSQPGGLDQNTLGVLRYVQSSLHVLKNYRDDVIAAANARPGKGTYTDPILGQWILMGGDSAGLLVHTPTAGDKKLSWSEIPPVALILAVRPIVDPRAIRMHQRTDAIIQLYSGAMEGIGAPPDQGQQQTGPRGPQTGQVQPANTGVARSGVPAGAQRPGVRGAAPAIAPTPPPRR